MPSTGWSGPLGETLTVQGIRTTRAALGLYGTLLVLPTLAFGWLYWQALVREQVAQLSEVPRAAEDAAGRIAEAMRDRLQHLVEEESARPFYHYGESFVPEEVLGDELVLQRSPLRRSARPEGLLAWFSFDLFEGVDVAIDVFEGDAALQAADDGHGAELHGILGEFRERKYLEHLLDRMARLGDARSSSLPLAVVALSKGHKQPSDVQCLQSCSRFLRGRRLPVTISGFDLEFYRREDGTPVAVASRRVLYRPRPGDLPEEAQCIAHLLQNGFAVEQGFLIDVSWLFQKLPDAEADRILRTADEALLSVYHLSPIDEVCTTCAPIYPVRELGFETRDPHDEDYGKLQVAINTAHVQARFAGQKRRFLGVAAMLVLTLATGMVLLYRSVHRELDQAHRTQNFVAAVTHELRTPLSTIRLHGEMLLEGWAQDPAKQREYHARIVRETQRLSTLVERVLEKTRLKERKPEPQPGDLNELIERLRPDLADAKGRTSDLRFDLAQGLPVVWVLPEAVAGILSNLVENARKYAPVPEGGEPIVVATRKVDDRVRLEVADRGPGLPAAERERIFEAFYRVGNERTRTTTGTGLGLHLVHLHAQTTGAEVDVQPRPGGGSVFRVSFRAVA